MGGIAATATTIMAITVTATGIAEPRTRDYKLPEPEDRRDYGGGYEPRDGRPIHDRYRPPLLNTAQRVLQIPFRFVKEAARDIVGHERHQIGNVPGSDYLTPLVIIRASTIY
jgi:hypothetical protein